MNWKKYIMEGTEGPNKKTMKVFNSAFKDLKIDPDSDEADNITDAFFSLLGTFGRHEGISKFEKKFPKFRKYSSKLSSNFGLDNR